MTEDADAGGAKILETANAEEEADREKLDKRIDAVNASSSTARNSWVFFLGLMAYLAVVTAGVTHKDLLLDNQIKLTALGEIPLSRFFDFAPVAFLIIYIGLLLQLASLADKVRALNDEISAEPEDKAGKRPHQHPLRDNLSTFMITQAIAGRIVSGDRMFLMRGTCWVTLGLLPVLLLVFFQTTYLPYHDEWATLRHQLLVVTGVSCAAIYVPEIMRQGPMEKAHALKIKCGQIFIVGITGFFAFLVATVPDSTLDGFARLFFPTQVRSGWTGYTRPVFPLTALLFEGDINTISGTPSRWLSRNLVVIDAYKDERERLTKRLSLRGRDLKYAAFDRSDFTGADFTGARLDAVQLSQSVLKHTTFGCGKSRNGESCSILRYGYLSGSNLEGAKLEGSIADHTVFDRASMPDADLSNIDFTRASFSDANLRGAKFQHSNLLNVSFSGANMDSAVFDGSVIILADLWHSILDFASFLNTRIILSSAKEASFIGTSFVNARLYGTDLAGALIWGAKSPDITAFAFGNLRGIRLEPSDMPDNKKPKWLTEEHGSETKKISLSKGDNLAGWKESKSYSTLASARSILSDGDYVYFESSTPLVKQVACSLPINFIKEVAYLYAEQRWDSSYYFDSTAVDQYLFLDQSLDKNQEFLVTLERIKKAASSAAAQDETNADWSYINKKTRFLGDPGPLIEQLSRADCDTAQKAPREWAEILSMLRAEKKIYIKIHSAQEKKEN